MGERKYEKLKMTTQNKSGILETLALLLGIFMGMQTAFLIAWLTPSWLQLLAFFGSIFACLTVAKVYIDKIYEQKQK